MTCKCIRCGKGYESIDPDAMEGFDKCPDCIAWGKQIALKVDLEMERRRKENPLPRNPRAELLRELLKSGGRINARDLDLSNWGS